jgi:Ni/Co efflux regulator RcnB
MRHLLLISLLATTAVAMPANAQDRGDRRGPRTDQSDSSSSEDRGSRRSDRGFSRRSDNDESTPSASQPSSEPKTDRRSDTAVMRERPQDRVRPDGGNWRSDNNPGSRPAASSGAGDSVRNWRGPRGRASDSPAVVQPTTPVETVTDGRTIEERNLRRVGRGGTFDRNVRTTPGYGGRVGRIGNNVPVEGTAPPPVTTEQARRGNDNHRRWTGDWRRDGRYDWRRHRDRNRSRFHIGFYFDPFGWSYRRYNVGWRLWPSYYGQDYWLNDPWSYRLPPAYGPYRWVRYYDDALLVNIYTGTVVDVIHNFFW